MKKKRRKNNVFNRIIVFNENPFDFETNRDEIRVFDHAFHTHSGENTLEKKTIQNIIIE